MSLIPLSYFTSCNFLAHLGTVLGEGEMCKPSCISIVGCENNGLTAVDG